MVATYTQLLAERYKGKLDADADKYIHYAVDGALRMQVLVRDLLAFSRIGRQGIEFVTVDCNAVMGSVLKNLQAAIEESGARVVYENLPTLTADESQITQLLQNLIGNGITFRGKEAPLIQIASKQEGRDWIFSVADNGIGIAPEHSEIVFEIFKRLHTRTEYPGSGIGLSICKRIIEYHGGRIWVERKAGPGCTFQFTLPVRVSPRKSDLSNENDA